MHVNYSFLFVVRTLHCLIVAGCRLYSLVGILVGIVILTGASFLLIASVVQNNRFKSIYNKHCVECSVVQWYKVPNGV